VRLTTITQVSLDGVMQGPGANPVDDEELGFDRRGWAHFDAEAGAEMDEIFRRADAFVFGRRTYQHFADTWGTWDDPGDSPIWTALNTLPKHVVTATLRDPTWAGTSILAGDVAASVRDLKAGPGRELQVHGSGMLVRSLLDADLVDELTLFIFPVVVGAGTRLFPEAGRARALELVRSRSTSTGVTIQRYRPLQ
jgi:dihydrofolate reductase